MILGNPVPIASETHLDTRPSVFAYEPRHRRIGILPWLITAVHFAATFSLFRYSLDKALDQIASGMFNSAYRPPPPTLFDHFTDIAVPALSLPIYPFLLLFHVTTDALLFAIPIDSIIWCIACWGILRFVRRTRPL
jgi:hypothetical protein